MQITETRKKIIDILEPFMDKTLDEGVVFYSHRGGMYGITNHRLFGGKYIGPSRIKKNGKWCSGKIGELFECTFKNNGLDLPGTRGLEYALLEEEIIGHYDITALICFIRSKSKYIEINANRYFVEDMEGVCSNVDWTFPNKPLHLYNEEEDKKLLEILTKLK